MKKFVVLYIATQSAQELMAESSPEAAQEGMKAWMQWADKAGEALVDLGTPLGAGKEVTSTGVSDTESTVGGYSVLQAEDMDGALALLEGHPHLMLPGASIRAYEALDMPGA
ncbi:YciI family protein [Arthrobacter oryzae]|uniref:YciI family protein n=1 Tax=Arthrobacter oryzae TaxID=409290 RepID=UPI00286799A6|nr:YciI family protein [Arthrobacter oryzae]MDR6506862.1 hypothetical protein [Arthrobacter oryzae]